MISRRTSRGVTLTEMMVVVAIVGVLATVAYWGMSGVVPGYRLSTAARDVSEVLVLTRARAIAQNRNYTVQFQASTYQVFWDQNGNGVLDAGDQPTQAAAYGQGVTYFRPTTNGLSSPPLAIADVVVFDPSGKAANMPPAGLRIGLANGSSRTREVEVRYSGLVKKL